ncbi:MAG: hypothetical protein QMD46_10700 [Methanomicrobiales archaeon]|nr:hypothetical protein [Methanomicrobiales archaeon]MDI6876629.1 hypothetical protein [Methanomicrobiales archaeon]
MEFRDAGYVQKSGDHLIVRIPRRGTYVIHLQEVSGVLNRGETAPLVARSRTMEGEDRQCWFEAGRMRLSRSKKALLISLGECRYLLAIQSLARLLSNTVSYAAVREMAP